MCWVFFSARVGQLKRHSNVIWSTVLLPDVPMHQSIFRQSMSLGYFLKSLLLQADYRPQHTQCIKLIIAIKVQSCVHFSLLCLGRLFIFAYKLVKNFFFSKLTHFSNFNFQYLWNHQKWSDQAQIFRECFLYPLFIFL